jgi:M6 family metalloprotease-like protein
MVTGTIQVPVIAVKYADTSADPYPTSDLQKKLFDGPNPTGTVTDLYSEMSYGNLTMRGTVYPVSGWLQVSQNRAYYVGAANGTGCDAKTGEFLLEALTALDVTVDFGLYDNDGPDGLPNSGDDDGFVDVLTVAHPDIGAECFGPGSPYMWAHRWVVGGWPAFGGTDCGDNKGDPWETNDPRPGGELIKIWDYVMVPGQGAGNGCGAGITEIGVYCHEFGHALGLPDLYDTDGGGQVIGVHGLMGSGNWNQPSNPPHFAAWSKAELGWLTPIVVGMDPQDFTIANVNQNATVYQLNVSERKWRRQFDVLSLGMAFVCGLDATEGDARNWPSGAGYGNGWLETAERDFLYDGTGPVTFGYDVSCHTEEGYDSARVKIDVGGTMTLLASYTGLVMRTSRMIDLTPHLSGSGVASYRIILEFESDRSVSDEDRDRFGNPLFDSGNAGPFKLDDVSVTGGGEDYSCDFETDDGGWVCATPAKEFFLVENRSTVARFDKHLKSEGLYIWHVEENVAHSDLGNTGGTSGTSGLSPAGVTLMEADGSAHLLRGRNRGDGGDAFPGTADNHTFLNTTNPDSRSHNLAPTNVVVRSISSPGTQMTATMQGGEGTPTPPPSYSLTLFQSEPNPFVPGANGTETLVGFSLPIQASVSLNVFDVKGRLVARLASGPHTEGMHSVPWDGTNARGDRVASGVYFYQLRAGGQAVSRKMVLLR